MNNVVIIFDWDDTLIDIGKNLCQSQYDACHTILQQTIKYQFTKSWTQPSITDLKAHTGQRFKEIIMPSVFSELDITQPEHQAWQQDLTELFWQNYSLQPKKLFPKISQMLEGLKDNPLAIATNKSRHLLMDDMKAVGLSPTTFDMIICGDDKEVAQKFKPHPNMINIIQHHFSNANNFIMVGDRKFDITAAQNSTEEQLTKTIAIAAADNNFNADLTMETAADITTSVIQDLILT